MSEQYPGVPGSSEPDPQDPQGTPATPYGQPSEDASAYPVYGQQPAGQQPAADPYAAQQPYGQQPAADPYAAQQPYGQAPYGQQPDAQAPYGQAPYGQQPNAQAPYGQAPYAQQPYGYAPGEAPKTKLAAGLLGIFLGSFGVHRFYLGYTGIGIAQIAVSIVTCGVGGIWGLVEGILYLTSNEGTYSVDAKGRKLV